MMEDLPEDRKPDEENEKEQLLKELYKLRIENEILKERMEQIKRLVSLK